MKPFFYTLLIMLTLLSASIFFGAVVFFYAEPNDPWHGAEPTVPQCTPHLNYYEVTVAEDAVDPTIDLFRERGWTNIQSGPHGDHHYVSGECHA